MESRRRIRKEENGNHTDFYYLPILYYYCQRAGDENENLPRTNHEWLNSDFHLVFLETIGKFELVFQRFFFSFREGRE